jgi:spore coat protein H
MSHSRPSSFAGSFLGFWVGALVAALLPAAAAAPPKPAPKPAQPAPKTAAPTPRIAPVPPPRKATPPARPVPPPPPPDASLAFFREGRIPRLDIRLEPAEWSRLQQQNRAYARCTVVEDGQTRYEAVGIKLKGAAGSFQGLDGKPALTLNFDKFKEGQSFHDLDKVHLNNSVQDPTYLNELLCSELFLGAGVPTPRTTHARVRLNDRDLGFFVLKEGFGKGFLRRNGLDPKGNLYEGAFVQDVDGQAELDSGSGPTDRSDIGRLLAACREPDPARRRVMIEQTVDVRRFLTFVALEAMTCHWDGYSRNRNNYRFYFDPLSGKVQFFPHGMDQMFGDPGFGILDTPGTLVTRAVLSVPEWRADYRDRIAELLPRFVPPDRLLARLDLHARRIRPVVAQMSEAAARELDHHVAGLRERIGRRAQSLAQQNAVPEPRPLRFSAGGVAQITGWSPRAETPDARLEKVQGSAAKPNPWLLSIAAGPGGRCVASWRARVILAAGRYRFEARGKAQDLRPLPEGGAGGAGIRISGVGRENRLVGTTGWTPLAFALDVQEPQREVELVVELRAISGQVTFEADSLRLVRLEGQAGAAAGSPLGPRVQISPSPEAPRGIPTPGTRRPNSPASRSSS